MSLEPLLAELKRLDEQVNVLNQNLARGATSTGTIASNLKLEASYVDMQVVSYERLNALITQRIALEGRAAAATLHTAESTAGAAGTTGGAAARPAGLLLPAGTSADDPAKVKQLAASQTEAASTAKAMAVSEADLAENMRMAAAASLEANQGLTKGALSSEAISAFANGTITLKELGSQVGETISKFGGWTLAAGAVYGAFGAITTLKTGAVDASTAVQDLSKYIDNLNRGGALQSLISMSQKFVIPIAQVGQTASQFASVYGNQSDAMNATSQALAAQKLGGVDPTDSAKYLTAIAAQSGGPSSLPRIMDQLTSAQVHLGAGLGQMLPGVATALGGVKLSGSNDLGNLVGIMGLINQLTGLGGSQVGGLMAKGAGPTGFSSVPNQNILQSYGIDQGQGYITSLMQAIDQAHTKHYTTAQEEQLSSVFFPGMKGGNMAALFGLSPEKIQAAMGQTAAGAHPGITESQAGKTAGEASDQLKALKNNLEAIGAELTGSGFSTPFGAMIKALNEALTLTSSLMGAFNELPGGVKDTVSALLALGGGLAVAKHFNIGGRFAGSSNPFESGMLAPAFGQSSSKLAAAQASREDEVIQNAFKAREQAAASQNLQGAVDYSLATTPQGQAAAEAKQKAAQAQIDKIDEQRQNYARTGGGFEGLAAASAPGATEARMAEEAGVRESTGALSMMRGAVTSAGSGLSSAFMALTSPTILLTAAFIALPEVVKGIGDMFHALDAAGNAAKGSYNFPVKNAADLATEARKLHSAAHETEHGGGVFGWLGRAGADVAGAAGGGQSPYQQSAYGDTVKSGAANQMASLITSMSQEFSKQIATLMKEPGGQAKIAGLTGQTEAEFKAKTDYAMDPALFGKSQMAKIAKAFGGVLQGDYGTAAQAQGTTGGWEQYGTPQKLEAAEQQKAAAAKVEGPGSGNMESLIQGYAVAVKKFAHEGDWATLATVQQDMLNALDKQVSDLTGLAQLAPTMSGAIGYYQQAMSDVAKAMKETQATNEPQNVKNEQIGQEAQKRTSAISGLLGAWKAQSDLFTSQVTQVGPAADLERAQRALQGDIGQLSKAQAANLPSQNIAQLKTQLNQQIQTVMQSTVSYYQALTQANISFQQAGTADPVQQQQIAMNLLTAELGKLRAAGVTDPSTLLALQAQIRSAGLQKVAGQISQEQAQQAANLAQMDIGQPQQVQLKNAVTSAETILSYLKSLPANQVSPTQMAQAAQAVYAAQGALAQFYIQQGQQLIQATAALKAGQTFDPVTMAQDALTGATQLLAYDKAHNMPAATIRQDLANKAQDYKAQKEAQWAQQDATTQYLAATYQITSGQEIVQFQKELASMKKAHASYADIQRVKSEIYNLEYGNTGDWNLNTGNMHLPSTYEVRSAIMGGAGAAKRKTSAGLLADVKTNVSMNVIINRDTDVKKFTDALNRALGTSVNGLAQAAGLV